MKADKCNPQTFGTKKYEDKHCICNGFGPLGGRIPATIVCMPKACKNEKNELVPIGKEGKVRGLTCKCLEGVGPDMLMDAAMQPLAHWSCPP